MLKDSNANVRNSPSSNEFSIPMMKTLGSLIKSRIFLNLSPDKFGEASVLGTPFSHY